MNSRQAHTGWGPPDVGEDQAVSGVLPLPVHSSRSSGRVAGWIDEGLRSHIAEEAGAASALKGALERVLPQLGAWVSSVDIAPGEDWITARSRVLGEAKAIIALCSPKSLDRPWVNFESGFGAGKEA
jgi:hypothetical protein